MSRTEIYTFDGAGRCQDVYGSVRNAWLGAMAVWNALEKRYLPPMRYPRTIDLEKCNEIWNLINDDRLSTGERIALGTTFDNVLVRKDEIPLVIEAFESFGSNMHGMDTSLPDQARILREICDEEDVSAVGWQQTTVADCPWYEYDDEEDECIPYDWKNGDKHWFLFDELPQLKVV